MVSKLRGMSNLKKMMLMVLTLLCAAVISACASARPLVITEFALDTVVTVSLYEGGTPETLQESIALCRRYDDLFSRIKSDSDIGRINSAGGQPVQVSDDTLELLSIALGYCEASDGALDITIGAASSLWDFKSETPVLPDRAALEAAVKTVDYKQVKLDGNTVTLQNPDARLDLGAVAKGFIADKMAEQLRGAGVTSAIINLGGNVYVLGNKQGKPFQIGIRAPFAEESKELGIVEGEDLSAVTSGVYERCFEKGGRLYHHILDTGTGYPADSDLSAVTILSAGSVDGDAMSTICLALGREDAEAFLEKQEARAVLVDRDNQIYTVGDVQLK